MPLLQLHQLRPLLLPYPDHLLPLLGMRLRMPERVPEPPPLWLFSLLIPLSPSPVVRVSAFQMQVDYLNLAPLSFVVHQLTSHALQLTHLMPSPVHLMPCQLPQMLNQLVC
jgi:hypothetical protein